VTDAELDELCRVGSDEADDWIAAIRYLRARLAEAERLLRPMAECDPDIREWLGMPRWPIARAPDNGFPITPEKP